MSNMNDYSLLYDPPEEIKPVQTRIPDKHGMKVVKVDPLDIKERCVSCHFSTACGVIDCVSCTLGILDGALNSKHGCNLITRMSSGEDGVLWVTNCSTVVGEEVIVPTKKEEVSSTTSGAWKKYSEDRRPKEGDRVRLLEWTTHTTSFNSGMTLVPGHENWFGREATVTQTHDGRDKNRLCIRFDKNSPDKNKYWWPIPALEYFEEEKTSADPNNLIDNIYQSNHTNSFIRVIEERRPGVFYVYYYYDLQDALNKTNNHDFGEFIREDINRLLNKTKKWKFIQNAADSEQSTTNSFPYKVGDSFAHHLSGNVYTISDIRHDRDEVVLFTTMSSGKKFPIIKKFDEFNERVDEGTFKKL